MGDVIVGRDPDRELLVIVHITEDELFSLKCDIDFAMKLSNWNPSETALADERLGIDKLTEEETLEVYSMLDETLPVSIERLKRGETE